MTRGLPDSSASGTGDNFVKIYFVMLDGVGSYCGYNVSRLFDGVLAAAHNQTITVTLGFAPGTISDMLTTIVKVNTTVSVVHDWETYKGLVESGFNVMIINGHDQYLPVPTGYTKEQWIDQIADAMQNRYVVWAHVGGYPFFNVYYQNGSTETWGEAGLQTLMNHINENDIRCWRAPYPIMYPNEKFFDELGLMQTNMSWDLQPFSMTDMSSSYPLNSDQFSHPENVEHPYIYENGNYIAGAILRFRNDTVSDCGLYVHVTPTKFYFATFEESKVDGEFARGYVTTAWTLYYEFCAPPITWYWTQKQIGDDRNTGKTYGVDTAERLQKEAQDAYAEGNFLKSEVYSMNAGRAADSATAPPLSAILYPFVLGSLGLGAGAVVYVGIARKRKNGQEKLSRKTSPPIIDRKA